MRDGGFAVVLFYKKRNNMEDSYQQQGLYSRENEHDACGVGIVAQLHGGKSHDIVEKGLQVLEHMNHRGAEGIDAKTGDGAGILVQIPHEFILLQGIAVPEKGRYGTGLFFLPKNQSEADSCMSIFKNEIQNESLSLIAVRDVPVDSSILGKGSLATEPQVKQVFVTGGESQDDLERKLYVARKKTEIAIMNSPLEHKSDFYINSLSTKTIVYKGMLTSPQLREYYKDLTNPNFTSAISLVHSRFSTNTFPTWNLAQPFRLLGHNGEINTIKGNRIWMAARESVLKSDKLGDLKELFPIVQPDMSDSASLDNVFEFLMMAGLSLPHALSMLVPESWNEKNPISDDLKAFYEYHSIFMEPWDGPADLMFTDGRYVGGMLDRNGLRPARYLITNDDLLVMASETGVLKFNASEIREKGRLRPGKMFLIDTEKGEIHYDPEIKDTLAKAYPYKEWLQKNRIDLSTVSSGRTAQIELPNYKAMVKEFGYTKEDIDFLITSMALEGKEPVNSMGNDTPLAVISDKPQRLFAYFRQLFAQVTNPPIDPIREELVMSMTSYVGSIHTNLLEPAPEICKMVRIKNPILTNIQFDLLENLNYKGFSTTVLPMVFDPQYGAEGLEKAVDELCKAAENAVDAGKNYIVLSDRGIDAQHAAIPSLLAVSAVHHYLVEKRKRVQTAIVVETAEPREVMHFALLFGYGANIVNPYMAFAVLKEEIKNGNISLDYESAQNHYVKAITKGIMKIMSKMGIATIRSYRGAQIFEAIGIGSYVLDKYFKGTNSKIGGIDMSDIYRDIAEAHKQAFAPDLEETWTVTNAGNYTFRKDGELHAWNPETISKLQRATRSGDYAKFKEFTKAVDEKAHPMWLRDFMDYKRNPIDISEVEPASEIVKHFVAGAMSFGAISAEAHEAIAMAMNKLGTKSNTGEGGEDSDRYKPREDGLSTRSAIKQVASGRFGVTTEYLVNADEIQIKVAQGAKPGEGGQLPGFKVDKVIAKTRHSIPGISLISPPPHHDIYSIEDLKQLIFDLRNVNPKAAISVKLVSETGVGTIAAGVAKAKADLILISGAEGGTGASPVSSVKHAGLPGELGLAEAQQTLVMNNLRGLVRLQADGQLKTGRDIIISALLGAEEFGFGTSVLIVLGCVMMRKCHKNTCPMGVATQDPELRKRFLGRHEYVMNFFNFLAEDVREHLAQLGFRTLNEAVGRADLIVPKTFDCNSKISKIDISKLIYMPKEAKTNPLRCVKRGINVVESNIDSTLIEQCKKSIENASKTELDFAIENTDRTVGAMLSGEIVRKYGEAGLPDDTIKVTFKGSAGQSFGAFLTHGVSFRLEGDSNDYVGKGLSGGKIAVVPAEGTTYAPEKNIIAGNTILYGATAGEVYISGRVGERFCVRNSGAIAVVEGVGDHCCEYMTGGRAVILGSTGRNFAAGMSGGIAYVLNMQGDFDYFCNMEMVELSHLEDSNDVHELQKLIYNHYTYTGSPIAKRILTNWNDYVDKFIKVVPIEYKKVLHDERIAAINKKIAEVERDY